MKPNIQKGQEWEKSAGQWNTTRLRVLESPTSTRVKVGTVTKDGRTIRHREILTFALSNTPSGYRLVRNPDGSDAAVEGKAAEPAVTPTREDTLQAERDLARDTLADAMRKARDAALQESEVVLQKLWRDAQVEVDRSACGGEHRAYWNGQVTAHVKALNAIRAMRVKT